MTDGSANNCTLLRREGGSEPYLVVFVVVFIIVGLAVNVIILVAVIRSKKLRKNAYVVLVLLLCISDIILCINTLSFVLYSNLKVKKGKVNRIGCHVIVHFFLSGIATSLGQTLLICINRLLASVEKIPPNKFLFDRRRKYVSTIMVIFTVQMYFLIIFAFRGAGDEVDYCDFCALYKDGNFTVAIVLLNLLYCGLYMLIMISYLFTIWVIKSRFQKVIPGQTVTVASVVINQEVNGGQNTQTTGSQNAGLQRNVVSQGRSVKGPRYVLTMKAMKTLGLLLLFTSIFNLPFITACILLSLHVSVPVSVPSFAVTLVLLGCTLNPVLYTWRFQELREELEKMFRIKRNNP